MTELTLYEEAMCCSTGVCGPDPDAELVEVSAALDLLEDDYDGDESTVDVGAATDVDVEQSVDVDALADPESVAEQLTPINDTRYLFFTGKGGVGKSTVAATSATKLAEAGYDTGRDDRPGRPPRGYLRRNCRLRTDFGEPDELGRRPY